MEKSFIERLTDEQVIAFLRRAYPKEPIYSCDICRNPSYLYVRVGNSIGHSSICFSFYEYEAIGFSRPAMWIKYLYEIFGEEYKQAYLDYCAKIFN